MRKTYFLVMIMMLGIVVHATAQQEPIRLMRDPGVGNGKIAFTYQGDLWLVEQTGGCARRLTVHYGNEGGPIFSPDGRWIAFTGNYSGGENVFIMPVDGGRPKQLTYHPNGSWASGWTPDSKYVIFGSWGRTKFPWSYLELYKVSIAGGYPEQLPVAGSLSPDGRKIAFNHHKRIPWWRKRYKGSLNPDVWIYDLEDKTYEQITTCDGKDSSPMWGKDSKIYFVSDRNGIANIFAYSLEDKKIQQITGHTDDGVKHPSISPDGRLIVYENNGRLYLLETAKKAPQEVVVYAPTDDRFDLVEYVNPKKHIQDFDISPSGKRVVLDARGDIFTAPAGEGDIRNLTKTPGIREQQPAWSPNGKHIAYLSDISGEQEIYITDQRGEDKPVQLTDNGGFKFGLMWSPDSEKLLYHTTSDHYLYMVDVKKEQVVEVAHNDLYNISLELPAYSWSPDSKWIAYAARQKNLNADIYLYSVEKGESYQFTEGPTDDYNPVFTPDGKTLVYMSEPTPKPGADAHSNIRNPEGGEIRSISLLPEECQPYQNEEDTDEVVEGEQTGTEEGAKSEEEADVVVKVDIENAMYRVRIVPVSEETCSHIQVTRDHYYFLSSGTLYAFEVNSAGTEKIIDNVSSYRIASKGKKILIWDGSGFQIIDAGRAGGGDRKTVSLDSLTMKIDRLAEWQQIFHECWRMVRDYFYDENYHGVDWEGMRKRYAELLPYVRTRDGLNTLIEEMLGELNSSHQGIGGGDSPQSKKRYSVAMLGARLEPDYEAGYYRFVEIYKGDKTDEWCRSPVDADYVRIKEGDYLLAINGQPVPATENYLKYLVEQHQNHITLTTNSIPAMEGAIETRIKPITYESSLLKKRWLDRNTRLVEELSSGQIGYIHMAGMSQHYMDIFLKYFEDYRYKEGLIIDVRYNGGGTIEVIEGLIDMLERRVNLTGKYRNPVGESGHNPSAVFEGAVAVLCNEYSICGAEMFISAVKTQELGTVIGKQTPGIVLGAMKYLRLIDGGSIRKTLFGVWELDGTQLEGKGVAPDIVVENTPGDEAKGKDPQLEKAISYLMGEIKKSPRSYDYPRPIEER